MNARKVIGIPGLTTNIVPEDTVNNVPRNIAITEESVDIKTNKKFVCKFLLFEFLFSVLKNSPNFRCSGNYYGTQCELDGEVLGVAIGASVAAVIIIGLTLVCLLMWR